MPLFILTIGRNQDDYTKAIEMLKYYFYEMRPRQWVKNFFIFLPLIFAREHLDVSALIRLALTFIYFSLAASSIYLMNDLMDLDRDRIHPIKKLRPLASGKVSPMPCFALSMILMACSLSGSWMLKRELAYLILFYFVCNLFYSRILKRMVIVDVMCIGLFYILRVLAGAIVFGIYVSHWLVICTGLLALFIGFNKRRHELKVLGVKAQDHRSALAGYSLYFIDQMIPVLTASVVVFYTLYTIDDRTVANIGSKSLLLTVPFVYYGIFRYLFLVHKKNRGGDPTALVLSDKYMVINCLLWVTACYLAVYFRG